VRPETGFFQEQIWDFAPHERSPLPGSPATPEHPFARRVLYLGISILTGLTAGLGNALVSVNTLYLQGSLGLYQSEIAWLPAVYVMTNVPTGMILIKYRQQFGLRSFALIFQALYCVLTFAHLFVGGFAAAVIVRAASGIAASALTTIGLNYAIQALPAKHRLKGIAIGISVPQLAIPMARLFSTDLLAIDQWRALYLFEFGLAMISFGAIALFRLPPAVREKSFEWLDVPTTILFSIAMALVCAVLGVGRYAWWTDAAWIGWALAAAIPLLGMVILLEFHRANPIIDVRWLGTGDFMRFVMVGTVARIVLSEQTYGSVGLLNALGFTNDQLFDFSLLTVGGAVAGIVVSALIVGPNRLTQVVALAIGIVAICAFIDSDSTNLTRAPQLYVTQTLIAFATTLYIGPAILVGFAKVLAQGGKPLTSFIILFSSTQSLGGLIGTALLGTYQVYSEKQHSFDIIQHLDPADPVVAQALQQGGTRLAGVVLDPTLRAAMGSSALAQRVATEANVLAYNDVFRLVAIIALAATTFLSIVVLNRRHAAHVAQQAKVALGHTDA
jgi:MFS family permease